MSYLAISRGQSTEGDEIMDRVLEYLEESETITIRAGFVGSWALVVQWDKVHPYPHGAEDHQGVSEEFLSMVSLFQSYTDTI